MKLAFWKKQSGSFMSHSKGLTKAEVASLQKLKEGDRLILWVNDVKSESEPNLNLKVYQPKQPEEVKPTRAI